MPTPTRILIVEDDSIIASGLCYALEAEGYAATHCACVAAAQAEIKTEAFDAAVLDLSLPNGSGFDLCAAIRESRPNVPVLFLTAVDDEGNTVKGLEMGADDYITKPFRLRELLARLKSALRRAHLLTEGNSTQDGKLTMGDIHIDLTGGKVSKGGSEIPLTASEYRLLLMLARNKGQILTRERLLEVLWDDAGSFVNDNTLTVCVKRLREKLGDDSREPRLIETVRGLGYRAGG